jgi:hypothetical protein
MRRLKEFLACAGVFGPAGRPERCKRFRRRRFGHFEERVGAVGLIEFTQNLSFGERADTHRGDANPPPPAKAPVALRETNLVRHWRSEANCCGAPELPRDRLIGKAGLGNNAKQMETAEHIVLARASRAA